MIIFNLHAIVVGLIIAVIVGPIYWLMPDEFADSPVGQIILLSIGTTIAGICEVAELKGRLFFLPIWLLGIIGAIGYTYFSFGWKGIGILVLAIIIIIVLLILFAYYGEKKDWKDAYQNFQELKNLNNTKDKEFWTQVDQSKFFPDIMNYTHSICEYNFKVFAYLKFVGLEWEEIEVLIPVFQKASIQGNEIDIDSELTNAFKVRLDEVLEEFEEESDHE